MSEPTTYALPDEPDGPVWDKDGERWERDTDLEEWDLVAGYLSRTWPMLLANYGPVTSTPPWKPEVGGTVETAEQYAAMPEGSIVASDGSVPFYLHDNRFWCRVGSEASPRAAMADVPRTILRVGWELVDAVDSLAREVAR